MSGMKQKELREQRVNLLSSRENISADTPARVIIDTRTLLKCVCIPLTFTIVVLNIVYLDQRQPASNLSQLAVMKTANDSVRESLHLAKSSERTQTKTDFNLKNSK